VDLYGFDRSFMVEGVRTVAGIDEAGRGPLAGPVVAAAVILPEHPEIKGLRDSKKVPPKERQALFHEILAVASHIGVGISDVEAIEKLNILEATKKAMTQAVGDISVVPDMVLIDAVKLPSLPIRQSSPIRGDAKSACIAASSIVAKVVRDSLMEHYHHLFPQYGFHRHRGYATREHLECLKKWGPCAIHRRSFRGVNTLTLPL
jgi:ribonuclease HII